MKSWKKDSSALTKVGVLLQVAPKDQEKMVFAINPDFMDVRISVFSGVEWSAFSGL